MLKLNKELAKLSEHKTCKDDIDLLGKGVFGAPKHPKRNRRLESEHSIEPRIGNDYQAVLPEYDGSVCNCDDRGDTAVVS